MGDIELFHLCNRKFDYFRLHHAFKYVLDTFEYGDCCFMVCLTLLESLL